MFCPKCSTQTGSDASRYCRSCGFRLDIVALLMVRNGEPESFAPATAATPPATAVSPRKKGLRSGGKLLFSSLLMFPFIMGFAVYARADAWPLLIPATVFFLGVMRMLYAWLFEDSIPKPPAVAMPVAIAANRTVSPLPGAYQPPFIGRDVQDTSSINQPSSVIEQTTNLLTSNKQN